MVGAVEFKISESDEVFPGAVVIEDVLPDDRYLKLAMAAEEWRDAQVGGGEHRPEVRSTKNGPIAPAFHNDVDVTWMELCRILWKFGDAYGKHYNLAFSRMEEPSLLHYQAQVDFYQPHIDDGPDHPRIFSSVLYLNDVQEGGETRFNDCGFSVSPKAGRLVMFPATHPFRHEAISPVSGDKYAVVTWFDRP